MAKQPHEKTLFELAQDMCTRADSLVHLTAAAEITRRKIQAQLDACRAQIEAAVAEERAAKAAIETAASSKQNANYMLLSVIVATVAAAASAFSAYLSYAATQHPTGLT